MKQLLILFALVAVGSSSVWNGGFRIKFSIGINIGGSFFYDIPRTRADAIDQGWTVQQPPPGLPVTSVTLYCYLDRIVCVFMDHIGDVAGMQIAIQKGTFVPVYDMNENGFTDWTLDGVEYWTIQQFFATEEILASRRLTRNENKITENGGVWVVGVDKEVVHIANTTDQVINEGVFTRQSCIPWMGRHYYYNMTTETSCTDRPLFPWFLLVESDELVASGMVVFGTYTLPSGTRDWFEHPGRTEVEFVVPNAPECMYQLTADYGRLTMHIYYIEEPWLISCIFQ